MADVITFLAVLLSNSLSEFCCESPSSALSYTGLLLEQIISSPVVPLSACWWMCSESTQREGADPFQLNVWNKSWQANGHVQCKQSPLSPLALAAFDSNSFRHWESSVFSVNTFPCPVVAAGKWNHPHPDSPDLWGKFMDPSCRRAVAMLGSSKDGIKAQEESAHHMCHAGCFWVGSHISALAGGQRPKAVMGQVLCTLSLYPTALLSLYVLNGQAGK